MPFILKNFKIHLKKLCINLFLLRLLCVFLLQFPGLEHWLSATKIVSKVSISQYSLECICLCVSEKLHYLSLGSSDFPGEFCVIWFCFPSPQMQSFLSAFSNFFAMKFMVWGKWAHPVGAVQVASHEFSQLFIFNNIPVDHKSQRSHKCFFSRYAPVCKFHSK